MGGRHARVLAELSARFDFVGWYDVCDSVRCAQAAVRLRDEHEAIERAQLVVVATPISAHAATVERALAAGRHVLVEKPLGATAAEAEAMARAARGGARLYVGQSERFNPVVRALARLLRGDRLIAIDSARVGPSKPRVCRAADGHAAGDHGVLLNLGVHDFDLAAYLGGGEVTLRAAVGAGDDVAHALFEIAGGAVGHLLVDRTAHTKRRAIALATARWIYEGDLLAHRLVRTPREGGASSEVPLVADEPLRAQAVALADAIDGAEGRHAREIATGADGARAVRLAEQAAREVRDAAEKLSFRARA